VAHRLNELRARFRRGDTTRPKISLPTKNDVVGAVTGVIVNTPDVMADGVLAKINPAYGIYTLMITTPLAALFASTRLMTVVPTSAITVTAAASVGDELQGDERLEAFMMVTLVAGIFQLGMGLFKLGFLTTYISTSVMTGFLNGVLTLVILGQLGPLVGYDPEGGNSIARTIDLLANLRDIETHTAVIGVSALLLMIVLSRTRLSHLSMLAALAIATTAVQVLDWENVALIEDVSPIPSSLPSFHLPTLDNFADNLAGGLAVGIIGLVLGAGVSQRFPNEGGPRTDVSRDFAAQGLGNIGGSFFRALPGTGSLSATAVNLASKASSRWVNILQGVAMVAGVLVLSDLLNLFPETALAALLIYTSYEALDVRSMITITRTGWLSAAELAVTFVAALIVPLQEAILIGVVLAFLFYIARAGANVRVDQIVSRDGDYVREPAPDQLPSNAITMLDVEGNLFFAGARSLMNKLPKIADATRPVLILRLWGEGDASTTFFEVIEDYAAEVTGAHGLLILTDVDPEVREHMRDAGYLDKLGPEHVLVAEQSLLGSTQKAYRMAEAWLATID
jgi:sulfate permease, SulP family